jgi:phosphohistidine phosphatase SixA
MVLLLYERGDMAWPKPLIVIRHPEYDNRTKPNLEAPLTELGVRQADAVASSLNQRMGELGQIVLLTSPARRTHQLADTLATVLGVEAREAKWLADGPDSLTDLAKIPEWAIADSIIACGHEPALRRMLTLAHAPESRYFIPLTAVAEFSFDARLPRLTLDRLAA